MLTRPQQGQGTLLRQTGLRNSPGTMATRMHCHQLKSPSTRTGYETKMARPSKIYDEKTVEVTVSQSALGMFISGEVKQVVV